MWFLFALLSSVFAALTSILAKVGIEGVNSNLATAVRTVVVVIMAWVVVFTVSYTHLDVYKRQSISYVPYDLMPEDNTGITAMETDASAP